MPAVLLAHWLLHQLRLHGPAALPLVCVGMDLHRLLQVLPGRLAVLRALATLLVALCQELRVELAVPGEGHHQLRGP